MYLLWSETLKTCVLLKGLYLSFSHKWIGHSCFSDLWPVYFKATIYNQQVGDCPNELLSQNIEADIMRKPAFCIWEKQRLKSSAQ